MGSFDEAETIGGLITTTDDIAYAWVQVIHGATCTGCLQREACREAWHSARVHTALPNAAREPEPRPVQLPKWQTLVRACTRALLFLYPPSWCDFPTVHGP